MAARISSRQQIALHVVAALVANYVFTWGFIALGVAGLFAAGTEFHDAESLASMLGLLVFLTAFLWTFAARSLPRACLVLVGGGALMAGTASLIQALLIRAY